MPRKKENEAPEKVRVFDKEWEFGNNNRYRHDDGHFVFGIILLLFGGIFLLNSLGIISWNVWGQIWAFWPLLLIFWGAQMILGRSEAARLIVGIIALIVVIMIILFVVRSNNPYYGTKYPDRINHMLDQMQGIENGGRMNIPR